MNARERDMSFKELIEKIEKEKEEKRIKKEKAEKNGILVDAYTDGKLYYYSPSGKYKDVVRAFLLSRGAKYEEWVEEYYREYYRTDYYYVSDTELKFEEFFCNVYVDWKYSFEEFLEYCESY